MDITTTGIDDVKIFKPRVFADERGFFMETFRLNVFQEQTGIPRLVQDNHSQSSKGTLRGLHYQTEQTQGKLVRVISGSAFDVAVDLRQSSPHFGQWVGIELSAQNKLQLWIPGGFAHGFLVTSDSAEILYKCSDYYHPQSEVCIKYDDPSIGIDWPNEAIASLILSEKDRQGLSFAAAPKFP